MPDGRFNLTVSVRPVNAHLPAEAVAAGFTEFVRERRAAEYLNSEVVLTPEKDMDGRYYLYSKYAGVHPGPESSDDRRFAALITLEAGHTFTFSVESVWTTDAEFNAVAHQIFDSVEIV